MKRLIAGNWKMNLNPGEASIFLKHLDENIEASDNTEVVLCVPSIDLYPLAKEIDRKKFKLGAQNIHYLDNGPYTGEISAAMIKGLAQYVLVGHSERRAMGETDKDIAKKMAAAVRSGLVPILCVGENLHDRQHNLTEKVVVDQLTADLADLTAEEVAGIVIAYEPVWAINNQGAGKAVPATPDDIRAVYPAIRNTLEELYGEGGLEGVRLLYGGSANDENTKAYLGVEYVDGLLPGSASLKYDTFAKMVKIAQGLD